MSKGKDGDGAESFEAGLFLNEEYVLLVLDRPRASLLHLSGNAIPRDCGLTHSHLHCSYEERTFRAGSQTLQLLCSASASSKYTDRVPKYPPSASLTLS